MSSLTFKYLPNPFVSDCCKDVPVNSFVNIITDALTPYGAVIFYITMKHSFDNTKCIEIWTINVVHYKCTVRYDNVGHVICSIA